MKSSEKTNDGPEVKKPKIDPNETTMVKKVCYHDCLLLLVINHVKFSNLFSF